MTDSTPFLSCAPGFQSTGHALRSKKPGAAISGAQSRRHLAPPTTPPHKTFQSGGNDTFGQFFRHRSSAVSGLGKVEGTTRARQA